MAKTGPKGPSKPMSDKEFRQLVEMIRIQCTRNEICGILNMSEDTLNRRIKERGEENFAALYKKHSGEGKASLRRLQWQAAEAGNPTMLVWLGKNVLDQRDKVEQDHLSSDGSMTPPKTVILRGVKPDGRSSD